MMSAASISARKRRCQPYAAACSFLRAAKRRPAGVLRPAAPQPIEAPGVRSRVRRRRRAEPVQLSRSSVHVVPARAGRWARRARRGAPGQRAARRGGRGAGARSPQAGAWAALSCPERPAELGGAARGARSVAGRGGAHSARGAPRSCATPPAAAPDAAAVNPTAALVARQTVAHVVGEGVFLLNKLTPWTGNIVVRAHCRPRSRGRSRGRWLECSWRVRRGAAAHAPALPSPPQEGVLKRLAGLNKPLKYIGVRRCARRARRMQPCERCAPPARQR